jgi:hypothetical protein
MKIKTSKTVNKILAGAGIAALGTVALGMIAPNFAGGTVGKAIMAGTGFLVGGLPAAAGAVATEMVAGSARTFTGANSMGNLQESSL